jgi:hypothetical protein
MKNFCLKACALSFILGLTGCIDMGTNTDTGNTATTTEDPNPITMPTPDIPATIPDTLLTQINNNDSVVTPNTAIDTAIDVVPVVPSDTVIVSLIGDKADSITTTKSDCGNVMWCGSSGETNVNTGLENVSGLWFFYTDTSSGGNSEYTWPADPHEGWETVIQKCDGGICGVATLGQAYMYPYMGVGFLLTNDETGKSSDIKSWGGICVTYSSERPMRIAIHPKDSVQQLLDYDDYRVNLPKGENVTKNFAWSEFNQDGWGTPYDRDKLLTEVESINFVYENAIGESSKFNITKVGKYGTCK